MRKEDYILKNKEQTDSKIQRLLKNIKEAAISDRAEANELLASIKAQLSKVIEAGDVDSEEGFNTDSFVKLIQSAGIALQQAGAANEKLIKLANLLYKMSSSSSASGDKSKKSVFGELGRLIQDEED
jgi:hypothetical protein